MSTFEKLVIPFIEGDISTIDMSLASGFIDSYTSDPDRPSGDKEIFLVYDDRIRNEHVTKRAVSFDKSRSLKRKYVKVVNNIPYYVYVFCIKPGLKASTNGIVTLTGEEKITVLQFWNFPKDLIKLLVSDSSIATTFTHKMPLADYPEDIESGITIQKKEASS
jgi:hypothetical protein